MEYGSNEEIQLNPQVVDQRQLWSVDPVNGDNVDLRNKAVGCEVVGGTTAFRAPSPLCLDSPGRVNLVPVSGRLMFTIRDEVISSLYRQHLVLIFRARRTDWM
ncbi:hypothetical protein RSAG8_09600, partial [Rhizoctonia solani AG-8 WAC10335]